MRRNVGAFILSLVVFLLLYTPALANTGTDLLVGPGTIVPDKPLLPGHSYTLPGHEITNNSYVTLEMAVSVSENRDEERELPPADWFIIEPSELYVQARSEENVQVTLNLPKDAPPGEYKVWFLFDAMPAGTDNMAVAAAINVSLEFEVRDLGQSQFAGEADTGERANQENSSRKWLASVLGIIAVVGLGYWLFYKRS